MIIEAGHPYGTARFGAAVIAASFAVLVMVGVSGPAVASSSHQGSTSAGAVVAEAREA